MMRELLGTTSGRFCPTRQSSHHRSYIQRFRYDRMVLEIEIENEDWMIDRPYVLSFTAGGLLHLESVQIAEAYLASSRDWNKTVDLVRAKNLIQSRVESTTVRKTREIVKRLQHLTNAQLKLISLGAHFEQLQLLWLACCKRYQLIGEFASELIRERLLRLELSLTLGVVQNFVDQKTVWHAELEKITDGTRQKICTVMIRMAKEAGLVSSEGLIQHLVLSEDVAKSIADVRVEDFHFFPVFEADVKGVLE